MPVRSIVISFKKISIPNIGFCAISPLSWLLLLVKFVNSIAVLKEPICICALIYPQLLLHKFTATWILSGWIWTLALVSNNESLILDTIACKHFCGYYVGLASPDNSLIFSPFTDTQNFKESVPGTKSSKSGPQSYLHQNYLRSPLNTLILDPHSRPIKSDIEPMIYFLKTA